MSKLIFGTITIFSSKGDKPKQKLLNKRVPNACYPISSFLPPSSHPLVVPVELPLRCSHFIHSICEDRELKKYYMPRDICFSIFLSVVNFWMLFEELTKKGGTKNVHGSVGAIVQEIFL